MDIGKEIGRYIMEFVKNVNIVSLGIFIALLYPILIGFVFKLRSSSLINTIKSVLNSVSILVSLVISFHLINNIFVLNKYNLLDYLAKKLSPTIITVITTSRVFITITSIVIFIVIHQLIKLVISFISRITFEPLLDILDEFIKTQSSILKRVVGAIFQIPRGLCYALVLTFLLNLSSGFLFDSKIKGILEESKIYNYINNNGVIPVFNSQLAKTLPNIINDSFKIYDGENNSIDIGNNSIKGLVYYNGVTLEQGVKSDSTIDETAKAITEEYSSTFEKGKVLYSWVGREITYDDEKAVNVMNNDNNIKSGAMEAFYSKKGVCFDYACLYVAMSRANNIKVRLVVGEGYNGESWVSHAWNEIFIEESQKWISVDPTFYNAGDYYGNENFNADHRKRTVAGEW